MENKDYLKQIIIEYQKYLTTFDILDYLQNNCKSDYQKYEAKNILERWLLSGSNNMEKKAIDDKMIGELLDKKIAKTKEESELMQQKVRIMYDRKYESESNEINYKIEINKSAKFTDLRYGKFTKRIMNDRFEIMEKYGIENILLSALKYKSIISTSQQWHIPFKCYLNYVRNYGVEVEGFASPFNSQIMLYKSKPDSKQNLRFCSIFPETDKIFGSLGDFFENDFQNKTVSVNPPYILDILNKTSKKCIDECQKAEINGNKVRFYIIMASWKDCQAYEELITSKYLVYTQELLANKHFYMDSNDLDKGYQKKILSRFNSTVLVLAHGFDQMNYSKLLVDMICDS